MSNCINYFTWFYIQSILIIAIGSFLVGTLSLYLAIRTKTLTFLHIVWFLCCLAIGGWNLGYYATCALDFPKHTALIVDRLFHIVAIFIPMFFLQFSTNLKPDYPKNRKLIIFTCYLTCFALVVLSFTPLIIKDVKSKLFFKHYGIAGDLYTFYVLNLVGWVSYAHLVLIKIFNATTGQKRTQIKYFLFGSIPGFIGGFTTLPLIYGIPLPPYLSSLIIIYLIAVPYAIFRHQLMDITVVIRKTAVYSILATIITIAYFLLIYIVEGLFRGFMGYKSIPWTLSVIVIFTLIFQPLKDLIQNFVDKYFFKASQAALKEELIKAQEELKRTERLKAVGTLAAGMAHEIKNPLTGIKTFTEFLPHKYAEPGFVDQFYTLVSAEVSKINGIVQQLLDFSKPKALKLEHMNINNLIDQILSFLNNDLITHNIKVIREYNPTLPLLNIDPNQMKQVFLNLFLNAIDAMKTGGTLTITTKIKDAKAYITIQDTGTGISKKDLEHIFDPFYSTKDTGTGLGMSIVYGIIKEHNGEITVESELGTGTIFNIVFPIVVKIK